MKTEAIVNLAIERCDLYAVWQLIWFAIHYISGIAAIVAGGLATATAVDNAPDWIKRKAWIWGIAASLLSGVVTFLEPLHKAQTYKQSYYDLAQTIAAYREDLVTVTELRSALIASQNAVLTGQTSTELGSKRPENGKLNSTD